MKQRLFTKLSALLVPLTLSCSAASSHSGTTAQGGGPTTIGIHEYTDSDTVTGVASNHNSVFVGTFRGILRYPAAGGTPVRLSSAQGLPDDRIFAIAGTADGAVWAATQAGVVRMTADRFEQVGQAQPDVGRPTALLALDDNGVLLGGAQGIARYDGTHWSKLTDRYQVLNFVRDEGRTLVATAQMGVVAISADYTSVDEYGETSGIPDALARSVVPVGNGRFWALLQGTGGTRLGFYDGHRWFGYTHATERARWIAVVSQGHNAALVTENGFFEIGSGGDRLVATEASTADGKQHFVLHAQQLDTTPSEPTQPAPSPRGRTGRGARASRPAHPSTAAPASATPTMTSADNTALPPAPRPRNVPPYASPVETSPGNTPDAPRFGLSRSNSIAVPDGIAGAFRDASGLYLARLGLGVSRIGGSANADFRVGDLVTQHRPLSIATDSNNNVWCVTDDGGAVRYDGTRFVRARIDDDANVVPLMFWSRGPVVAAIARTGPNTLAAYRFADNGWQPVTARRIDLGGPGVVDVRFLSVDERGRFWVGVLAVAQGAAHDRGAALIDGNLPTAIQFNSRGGARRRRGRAAGARAPDDLSAIEFDSRGNAWFAGVTGATSITPPDFNAPATVTSYGEAQGLHGDVASDLSLGPNGKLYFATPDGLGAWDGSAFNFLLPGVHDAPRAVALAVDASNAIWAATPHGVWMFDGRSVHTLTRAEGLPSASVLDIAVDGRDRVWFATESGITIIERPRVTAAPEPTEPSSEPESSPDPLTTSDSPASTEH